MGLDNLSLDLNESVLDVLPTELLLPFRTLILIFQVVGVTFLVYLIFMTFRAILGIKMNRRIKKIEHKVNSIDHKLNILIDKKENKKEKSKKK